MAIAEESQRGPTAPQTLPENNKTNPSDYQIHGVCKIDPKTQKPAFYYFTICAPKHKIGFSMDSLPLPPASPSTFSLEKSPTELLKTIPSNNSYGDYKCLKPCSKNTAANMATLLKFFSNNINQNLTKYPNARAVYDKLIGSLDANCLSDDDLAIVKALVEENNETNRKLVADRIKDYVVRILLESVFPEEVAKSVVEFLMPQIVDILFQERNSI
ncbi:hypothetical protein TWF730_007424 [Orbilia blumenaviensis]|uniref:Uncharacterized protein n=1 Tax=Orbilia blumenaviensis TaxID=1796055 RepID=A0AAV9VA32_9PEZI